MNRHLHTDVDILQDRYDLPPYIRAASVTWAGNYIASRILRRLEDVDRYAFLDKSDHIDDVQLKKSIEKACSLLSRHANAYAQFKFGSMVHPNWYKKESMLLSRTKKEYYFYGANTPVLRSAALCKRHYCDKIVQFLSDILEVEMFLRDHSNRENSSLYIRMNTHNKDEIVHEDGFIYKHKDILIHSTVLFRRMWDEHEYDVAVIW